MRIAALFDIHGNLPALEAVLADLRAAGIERLVGGGDIVVGPMSREALALMRALDLPVLRAARVSSRCRCNGAAWRTQEGIERVRPLSWQPLSAI
jgi:hypothetical protein